MRLNRERIASATAAGLLAVNTLAGGASRVSAQELPEPGIFVTQECFTPGNYGVVSVSVNAPQRYRNDVSIVVSGISRSDFKAGQQIEPIKYDLTGKAVNPAEEAPRVSVQRTGSNSLLMDSVSLGSCEMVGNTVMPVGLQQNNEVVFPSTGETKSTAPNPAEIVPGTFLKTCHPDGTTQIDYFPNSTDPIVVGGFELDEHGVRRGSERGYTSEQIAGGEIVNVYLGNAQGARKVRATVLKGQVPEVSATDPLFSQTHAPVAVIDLDPC